MWVLSLGFGWLFFLVDCGLLVLVMISLRVGSGFGVVCGFPMGGVCVLCFIFRGCYVFG